MKTITETTIERLAKLTKLAPHSCDVLIALYASTTSEGHMFQSESLGGACHFIGPDGDRWQCEVYGGNNAACEDIWWTDSREQAVLECLTYFHGCDPVDMLASAVVR